MTRQFSYQFEGQLDGKTLLKQFQSKRRTKKSKIRTIFKCQCGKSYLSFPALYLHTSQKHNSKLSFKQDPQNCEITYMGNVTVLKFFVPENQQGHNLTQNINRPQRESTAFLDKQNHSPLVVSQQQWNYHLKGVYQSYSNSTESNFNKESSKKFLLYLLKYKRHFHKTPKDLLEEGPNYLNEYAVKHLWKKHCFQISNTEWHSKCDALLQFCHWMKENTYTNLIVQKENQ